MLYSHRSTVLHAFSTCTADSFGFSARDLILVVVPLFHANAWAIPFAAPMCGAKLVLPGPRLDPESIFLLLAQEQCTTAGGIPTIWLNFLAWLEAKQTTLDLSRLALEACFAGGTAPPRATIEKFRDLLGVFLLHAWGMTETSPLVTVASPLVKHRTLSPDALVDLQISQGRQMYGVELKLVGADGEPLPHDGASVGELKVRGNWVIAGYYKAEGGQVVDRGWLVRHRRRRDHRRRRLRATDRSAQRRHQVGRRMDFLDRDRELGRFASRRVRGGGDCGPSSSLAGASAAAGPAESPATRRPSSRSWISCRRAS